MMIHLLRVSIKRWGPEKKQLKELKIVNPQYLGAYHNEKVPLYGAALGAIAAITSSPL